jgi:hypothetical protein
MVAKVLYVELTAEDRDLLDRLTARTGAAAGRPVSRSDVVRQLVRDAAGRDAPVRIRPKPT